MLFNIATFMKTSLVLCQNEDTEILHKNRKQNLICGIKLGTLVGLPSLFGFFGVIFTDTEAFEYLFVVFACLQAFYMGVVFVCSKKNASALQKLVGKVAHAQPSVWSEE